MRDEEVLGLTYAVTNHYLNGSYNGTVYDILLTGRGEGKPRVLRYRASLGPSEDPLDELRKRLSLRIADRLLTAVRAGESRSWCAHDVLAPEGFRVRPKKLIGYSDPILVPYSDLGEFKFDAGNCFLWRRSKQECISTLQQNAPNFWPGYFAVCQLRYDAQQSPS